MCFTACAIKTDYHYIVPLKSFSHQAVVTLELYSARAHTLSCHHHFNTRICRDIFHSSRPTSDGAEVIFLTITKSPKSCLCPPQVQQNNHAYPRPPSKDVTGCIRRLHRRRAASTTPFNIRGTRLHFRSRWSDCLVWFAIFRRVVEMVGTR
ncbi:hypothetical protein BDU57DRAFT_525096 [Ampelomyces quisqualis]|uniref:Uncharacterized protein n=1 Tax=Ampelomyces quisqualis TaxID=50730 RepID=A0A6A5Q8G5_AMPQU|nr:hypothetical protein BDU57DRAFT_525096 [Ampelomyces quisqualis]